MSDVVCLSTRSLRFKNFLKIFNEIREDIVAVKESNFHKMDSSKRRHKLRQAKFVLLQFRFSDRNIDVVRLTTSVTR